ncbi:hypothetical protein E1176_04280 [Fulvivirga sp. RKSG066]|uniref:hypothetical protein n=1 Tax=Fulvivirga aurantia TaxID=2529383 RepID=UPI0012BCBE35|nr:hypothetical protein [Fulvivirga aurantia]MTI20229.1 hypothetical protein [Fulvivirga aurantia]
MRKLARLSVAMRFKDACNPEVSSASVAWHIDHSLRVINKICNDLQTSDPQSYKFEENPARQWVLKNKIIKRGIAQAPEAVTFDGKVTSKILLEQLEEAKKNLILFETLPTHAFFSHHAMGMFTRDEAKKFLKIHTQHHLSIIEDIISSKTETNKEEELTAAI